MRIIILLAICLLPISALSETTNEKSERLTSQAFQYFEAGRFDEAESLLKQALTITEKALGPDHPDTATSLYILGILYSNTGRYGEAVPLYQRALAIQEKTFGPDHPNTFVSLNNLAVLYFKTGRYGEAEPLFKRALSIREKGLGPKHPDTATSLNDLALLYETLSRYGEAEPLLKRALAIREKALGPDHPDTATSLNNLALLYFNTGRYGEAEPLFKQALAIQEKALGPDHPDTATSLNNLAALYFTVGRYDEAEPLYQRTLAIKEKVLGPDHPDTSTSLNDLAVLYKTIGRYDEAEPLFKQALAINEEALGPDHPGTALNLNNLASLYETIGRYGDAEPLHQRALAIREKTFGPDHPGTAMSLNNLATLYATTGRYDEAEPFYKRALAITEKALGPDHPNTATSLNNLAGLYRNSGRYDEVEPLYQRSLAIKEKVLGPDHPDTAISLNDLALLYKTIGRYGEAEPLYQRSLAIKEKALGPDHPDTATSLNNLASLYETTGRYGEAEPLYQRALAIREKALGPDHPDTATSLNNLGGLYRITGRYGEAEPLLKRALAINEKAFGPDHPDTATSLNNLGGLYDTIGRYGEAEPLYQRVLAIREKALGPDHPDTATSLNNLGMLYFYAGRYNEAEPLIRKSMSIIAKEGDPHAYATSLGNYAAFLSEQHSPPAGILLAKQSVNILQGLRHNVSGISKEALTSFDKSIGGTYHGLANMLLDQGRLAEAQQVLAMLKEEEYFEFIRRDAGIATRLTARASYLASEELWIKEYEAISVRNVRIGKELGELRTKAKYYPLNAEEKRRLATLTKEDEQATVEFNDYLARLLKSMKDEASANADRIEDIGEKQLKSLATLKSMLKNLGEGSVLLHYLITDERLHILLTTPDAQLARHSDINAKDLNRKIFALRDALTNTRIDPRPVAKELYDLLIAPVAKDLQASQATTLMLSLDGALRYLPFGALHDGKSYVAQSYRTAMYVEVARDKVALPAMRQWKVAALGVSDKVHADFPPLPNVPAELNAIVKNSTGGIIPGEIRLNKYFTENAMTDSSHRNPVVHIASHFRFVPGSYSDSFLLLGDGSTLSLDRLRGSRFFQETELLTLSACETAMGSTGKGVEIEGFGAIAMNQGAKSVIATLWPVSDKSTARLMKEFYRLREEKNMTKAEALRQAQLTLLQGEVGEENKEPADEARGSERTRFVKDAQRPYSHPYYWAPFILMGNWK